MPLAKKFLSLFPLFRLKKHKEESALRDNFPSRLRNIRDENIYHQINSIQSLIEIQRFTASTLMCPFPIDESKAEN